LILWVDTLARFAVVLLHGSTFHGFGAAIAAIVPTAFVVVIVVAIAVALVLRRPAGRLALVLWVDALAHFAELRLQCSTFHGFGAAITAIVITVFVVVIVVANAVALVLRRPAGRLALVLWVDALARFAVVLLHLSAFHSFRAAIAAIISTAFVVVLVVAIAVSLVLSHPAGRLALILWVDALAHFAELRLHWSTFHTFSAAVAAIVITAFVVVIVVAIAVALVLRRPAGRLARFALVLWVDALARFAVLRLHLPTFHGFGAAVAAIVATVFFVVRVVAIAVSLVLRERADHLVALVLWVDTLAHFAELRLQCSTFHTFSAAVAAIVITAFVVVIVIANAVALVLGRTASFFFWCRFFWFVHFHASSAAHVRQADIFADQAFKALFARESILFVNQFVKGRASASLRQLKFFNKFFQHGCVVDTFPG